MATCASLPVHSNVLRVPSVSKEPTETLTTSSSLDDPPDGGKRAWIVVFGSTLALFATTGLVNAYVGACSLYLTRYLVGTQQGVFQAYYKETLLSNSTCSTIALIGGLQLALVYGGGPITGRIFDAYGLNIMFTIGLFLVVMSQMFISICQQNHPYQFFLSQGVMCGLGTSMIFTPAVAVIGHWFKYKRAYVLGIVVAGCSLGGLVYPIMLQRLIDTVGFSWAVRISGFVTLACLLVARLCTRTRLAPQGSIKLSQIVDLHGFRDVRYTLTAIASFLYFYALFIPYFYVQEYAKFQGVPPNVSHYLLAIINGCGIPARIVPGFLGDRFGVLQVLIPPTIFSGTIVLVLWLPARGVIPIVLFSILYGTFSSGFASMLPAYIATISPVEKFGARLGALYFFVALACLVGTPTAGAFVPTFTEQNFNHLIIFTGILLLIAAGLIGLTYMISRPGWYGHDPHEGSMPHLSSPIAGSRESEVRGLDDPSSDLGSHDPEKNV